MLVSNVQREEVHCNRGISKMSKCGPDCDCPQAKARMNYLLFGDTRGPEETAYELRTMRIPHSPLYDTMVRLWKTELKRDK